MTPTMDARELACRAREAALAKKATDVVILDVRGLSPICDYVVIGSATVPPHLKAVATGVQHALKHAGVPVYRRSGHPEDGWMALDYVDVVVHCFMQEVRDYYALEELWVDVPRVP
jgi:ribosome-associated protein